MTFAEKIKEERLRLKLTQKEFADVIGVTQKVVSSYENGVSLPRGMPKYKKIADSLGLRVEYLVGSEERAVKVNTGRDATKHNVEKLADELTGLFAGGEVAEEDMDMLMLAVQEAYIFAKRKKRVEATREHSLSMRVDGE